MRVKENRQLAWTLVLLHLSGALCKKISVNYLKSNICAVTNSTVIIPCSFYCPDGLTVKEVMWSNNKDYFYYGPFIYKSKDNTSSKFEYIGDKEQNCSLKIHKVEKKDAGEYAFRFETTSEPDKMTGLPGSKLKVVDLKVSSTSKNGHVKEGDSVNLTCKNNCDKNPSSSTVTWFKNNEPTNEGPVLALSHVATANTGNYTCSLRGNPGTASRVININVEYGPKNTSVKQRLEADAGSNYTLMCTCHANPPAESFIWFKIENGNIVDVGHRPMLFSGVGGQYFCSASNKHGSQNSSVVIVGEHWTTVYRLALFLLAVPAILVVIAVYFAIKYKKKRTTGSENHLEEDVQDVAYVNCPDYENNQPQEGNHKDNGETDDVIYTIVHCSTHKRQLVDSHDNQEEVIYSTVCK